MLLSCNAYDQYGRYLNASDNESCSEATLALEQSDLKWISENQKQPSGCPERELRERLWKRHCAGDSMPSSYTCHACSQEGRCPTKAELEYRIEIRKRNITKYDKDASGYLTSMAVSGVLVLVCLLIGLAIEAAAVVLYRRRSKARPNARGEATQSGP